MLADGGAGATEASGAAANDPGDSGAAPNEPDSAAPDGRGAAPGRAAEVGGTSRTGSEIGNEGDELPRASRRGGAASAIGGTNGAAAIGSSGAGDGVGAGVGVAAGATVGDAAGSANGGGTGADALIGAANGGGSAVAVLDT